MRGLHYGSPAVLGAASADVELLQLLVVPACALVLVVVRKLATWLDPTPGVDEELLASDYRLAVGIARVVDEARIPSANCWRAVDHGFLVQGKKKGVVTLHLRVVVPAIGFVVVDPLPSVFENTGAFSNVARGKDSSAVDFGDTYDI